MTLPVTSSVTVQGEPVAIPVEVRDARSWFASFPVPLAAARELIAYTGLDPATTIAGRAMLSLAFVRYVDSDLGPYHEVAIAVLVRGVGASASSATGKPGVLIHQLPVNQTFTCAAGREIWGFPKFLAQIEIVEGRRADRCTLTHDGAHVLTLSIGHGVPAPIRDTALDAYSFSDGVLRRTRWSLDGSGPRVRPAGARLELGQHPIAGELRALGLPHAAMMSGSLRRVRMTFDAAEVLT